MAGVPVLAAVSAPSTLAVDLAADAGLTLVGFLRGATMNVYAGAARVVALTRPRRAPLWTDSARRGRPGGWRSAQVVVGELGQPVFRLLEHGARSMANRARRAHRGARRPGAKRSPDRRTRSGSARRMTSSQSARLTASIAGRSISASSAISQNSSQHSSSEIHATESSSGRRPSSWASRYAFLSESRPPASSRSKSRPRRRPPPAWHQPRVGGPGRLRDRFPRGTGHRVELVFVGRPVGQRGQPAMVASAAERLSRTSYSWPSGGQQSGSVHR